MIVSARSTTHRGWTARARVPLTLSVALIVLVTGTLSSASAAGAHRGATGGKTRISYFFVPSLHTRPWRITPGPDGNLWFTDTNSDMIGTITPDGQVTEYPIGDGKLPYDIVAGRDGNLWFTENVNDKAGAVNTDGQLVHEYYAPGVDARPAGITVAPNGDIWWVDSGAGQDVENDVSHLTKDGDVINHQLFPCPCFGIGITSGPDGKLWAVEEFGVADGEAKGTVDKIRRTGPRSSGTASPRRRSRTSTCRRGTRPAPTAGCGSRSSATCSTRSARSPTRGRSSSTGFPAARRTRAASRRASTATSG